MEARPTLDLDNLESPSSLVKSRRRALKRAMLRTSRASDVVSKYRRKQRRLLDGESDSDPDPYDPYYVFYCLDA
jgi:hypothetical protein